MAVLSGMNRARRRDPHVASALPNIYNREQLREFAAASDVADVTDAQAATIEALYDSNYGLPVEQEAGLNPETRRRHAAAAKGAASR